MYEATLDMDNQPGITNEPITRSMVKSACRELGIEASAVATVSVEADTVTVTAFAHTTDGAKVLPHRGPHGVDNGYLKHTYTVRIVDDEEAMTPSEYRKHKAGEDFATYKRVREQIISRYGDEEAYLEHTS